MRRLRAFVLAAAAGLAGCALFMDLNEDGYHTPPPLSLCRSAADCDGGGICCGSFGAAGVPTTTCQSGASCETGFVQICANDLECAGITDGGLPADAWVDAVCYRQACIVEDAEVTISSCTRVPPPYCY